MEPRECVDIKQGLINYPETVIFRPTGNCPKYVHKTTLQAYSQELQSVLSLISYS